jgi:hypothetical protein
MANLFEGTPDARQLPEEDTPTRVSRFRQRYRQLNPVEVAHHDAIKDHAELLAELIERLEPGRYRALALTSLEASVMWAVKQLTANPGELP